MSENNEKKEEKCVDVLRDDTLTDDDLQYAGGKQDELVGRIQKRTGETREAVEKAVKESCSDCSCN